MSTVSLKIGVELNIRKAERNDAQNIINYVNIIAGESENITFGPGEFEITLEEEITLIDNIAKSNNKIFMVGLIGNELVSVANVFSGKRPRTRHSGELGISVLKKYWRMGIGKAMMEFMINWAREAGMRKLNLRVRIDNLGAIDLYKSLGFLEEGTITREFYIRGDFFSSLDMGLEIDK